MKPILTLLLSTLLLSAVSVNAQTASPAKENRFEHYMDSIKKAHIGKRVPLGGVFKTVDGKTINFSKLEHPVFICCGFYGCHPCEHELPAFVAATTLHPDVDFVYITYDSEETRTREFNEAGLKDFKPAANYYIIHMESAEIRKRKLANGYPTKYFAGKNGLVTFFDTGGNPSEPLAKIQERIAGIITEATATN